MTPTDLLNFNEFWTQPFQRLNFFHFNEIDESDVSIVIENCLITFQLSEQGMNRYFWLLNSLYEFVFHNLRDFSVAHLRDFLCSDGFFCYLSVLFCCNALLCLACLDLQWKHLFWIQHQFTLEKIFKETATSTALTTNVLLFNLFSAWWGDCSS